MKIVNSHYVPQLTDKQRLSDYLTGIFSELPSRKSVKKAIRRGEVMIDGEVVGTGHWVLPQQQIQLLENTQTLPKILELKMPVIYEDDTLAVINKPAGLVVSGNQFRTVQHALLYNLATSDLPDALRLPRPVHRLDAATSGLLLIAKTATAIQNLSQQFAMKQVQKRYRAIVSGGTAEEGVINIPIENQESESYFRCIKKVPSLKNQWVSLLDLFPKTGRTHQLRIHCAESGFPIMGDQLYGKEGNILWKKGLFLAAVELQFLHPLTRERIMVKITEPNKFKLLMEREERRFKEKKALFKKSKNGVDT